MPLNPPSLMRALGLLTGDLWHAVTGTPRAPTDANSPTVVRHETHEQAADTPAGRVTLRRTTIEEVELAPPPHNGARDP